MVGRPWVGNVHTNTTMQLVWQLKQRASHTKVPGAAWVGAHKYDRLGCIKDDRLGIMSKTGIMKATVGFTWSFEGPTFAKPPESPVLLVRLVQDPRRLVRQPVRLTQLP